MGAGRSRPDNPGSSRSRTSHWAIPTGSGQHRSLLRWMGEQTADMAAGAVCGSAEEIKVFIDAFGAIGVDEIMFNPVTDDVDEVARLAEIVF
jgi:hypothetical protein